VSPEAPTRSVRFALAIVASATTATALYALIRVAQALLFSEPDPALIIWSPHAGFFWRSWTAAYIGTMIGAVVWVTSAASPALTLRAVGVALVVATGLIAAQGILVP
jgi:hypothetical protein